ncbi:phosphotransferase [Mycolicibacterium litorale]|uniref:phosphotransferase n=1 Tax=Mycolicibacterium litorale TaxID=758802 RepID=UPI003CF23779
MTVDSLTSRSARIPDGEAQRIAAEYFAILGEVHRLAGEKDEIFRIRSVDTGQDYFLKIAHEGETEAAYRLVTRAMLHVAGVAPAIPVARIVPAVDGSVELAVPTDAGVHRWTRMTTFLPGVLLKTVETSPQLRFNVGRSLAYLAGALRSFSHPAAERRVGWDIARAGDARPLLDELDTIEDRDVLLRLFDHHADVVAPRLQQLRRQPVHNDLNTDNVLVDPETREVLGLLDFDDLTVSQLVNDLATAAAGHVGVGADPLAPALDVVRGYHRVTPLEDEELALLPRLMAIRLAMYLVIGNWRAERFPENRAYILRKGPLASAQLRRLAAISPADGAAQALHVRTG